MKPHNHSGKIIGSLLLIEKLDQNTPPNYKCLCVVCGKTLSRNLTSIQKHKTTVECFCIKKAANKNPDRKNALKKEVYRDNIKKRAKEKNFECIEFEIFNQLSDNPCYYCQRKIEESGCIKKDRISNTFIYYHGLDRKNSSIGYIKTNIVACCQQCNLAKRDSSIKEFKDWVTRCYNYIGCVSIDKFDYVIEDIKHGSPIKNRIVAIQRKLYTNLKSNCKNVNNLKFELSFIEFLKLINGACKYCGIKNSIKTTDKVSGQIAYHNSIDRVDSSIGYNPNNCVSCCKNCNYAKNEYSETEFLNMIKLIFNNMENI